MECKSNLSAITSLGPLDAQARAEVKGQAGIADGGDVLIVGEVFRLAVNAQPWKQFVAGAQIQLGVTEVQIPVWQDQRVQLIDVFIAEKGGIVAAAGKRRGE